MNILIIVFFLLFTPEIKAEVGSLSFGPVTLGASLIPLKLENFSIISSRASSKIKAEFIADSVQWVRDKNNLLLPRARVRIHIIKLAKDIAIKYLGKIIIPIALGPELVTEFYIDLFTPQPIVILQGKNTLENLVIHSKKIKTKQKTHLIDHSCYRYHVQVKGIENEYLSLGCRLEIVGKFGHEEPILNVTWAATNYHLPDGTLPPFSINFHESATANFSVVNQKGEKSIISIKAKVASRSHRLKFAYGFGPYMFGSKIDSKHVRVPKLAPAFMLYSKLDLTRTSSIRAFDALVFNKSFFNNFGLYFAYEVANIFDGKVSIVPLLGAQLLTFSHDIQMGYKGSINKMIYPQGFEIVYRHAFDIKNYLIVYGMFISTQEKIDYVNAWVRWGKGPFWELNYIEYGEDSIKTSMWGLSIGLGLPSFL